jgi:hypothetical protein
VAAAAIVVACSPKSGDAVTGPPGIGPQLTDADMPHPKPGLWDVKSAVSGERQTCLSGPVLTAFGVRAGCNQISRQHTADGGVVMDTVCTDSSHTNVSAKGDFQSAFTVALSLKANNSPLVTDRVDYRYVGNCAPGQHPDDQL